MAMKLSALSLLNNRSQTAVLRFLWKSRAEWSGREIARQTGISAPACHQALKQLDAGGLALFRRIANLHLYQINPENYLVEHIFTPLFKAEAALPGQVLKTIAVFFAKYPGRKKTVSAVTFGSMVTGRKRLHSGLDLLVVTADYTSAKKMERRIQELQTTVYRKFNIQLSPYIQTLAGIKAKLRQKSPLIARILKNGRRIYGKDLKVVLL
ncbi:MAG: hypothetical protein NTX59_05635 [Elusimicrobia bacterium]|nr:hypothetical protein [Elusimicrobiota bacterium]